MSNAAQSALSSTATARIERGTPAFRRTNRALFAAGFSTFSLLYCVQPLLPVFSREFRVSAAASSLALSATTGLLAVGLLVAGSLSEAWGRRNMMVVSLFVSALLTAVLAFVSGWNQFLFLRAAAGLSLSGLPAISMAYLSEEMDRTAVGPAMGLFIAASALGGMSGRILVGVLTDLVSWRFALGVIGAIGLISAWVFWRSLPASSHFHPRPLALRGLLHSLAEHLREPGLRLLFVEGFLVMGSFVTIYNYLGYRLEAPPYRLSHSAVGMIFAVYLFGAASSTVTGNLLARVPRRKVFWGTILLMLFGVLMSLLAPVVVVIFGVTLLTIGFFGAHTILSSWVGLRAQHAKGQASSLYLFLYYMGSSFPGSAGGVFWAAAGWPGVAGFVASLLVVASVISLRLTHLQPLATAVLEVRAPQGG
ncbi:MAG: MFS transporter [Candidatus Korobacteraceae bacterium]